MNEKYRNKYNFDKNIAFNEKIDEIDFNEIWRILLRRKKLIIYVAITSLFLLFGNTVYKRLFNPLYRGSFSLLINDPMSLDRDESSSTMKGAEMFERLAKNTTTNDLPTLLELLKSESLLKDVAKKYNLPVRKLSGRIIIEVGGPKGGRFRRFDRAEGILVVNLNTKSPKKDITLLEDLSQAYLKSSLDQRQQRLIDGLDFLNKQEPILKEKTGKLEGKIVSFREKYSLLQPALQGKSLIDQELSITKEIAKLESERNRLKNVKNLIKSGKISSQGYEEAINNKNSNGGLTISDLDKSLIQQILIVENELAVARSKYTENSIVITSLQRRLKKLQPIFVESQTRSVDAALILNKNNLNNLKNQRNNLQDQFLQKPQLIKDYNALNQDLDIAKKNLIALVSARENLQLQIAQNNIPWKIIESPKMRSKPIRPSLKKGLRSAFISSIILSISAAFIRQRFDNKYSNPSDLAVSLKRPLIGNIPFISYLNSDNDEKNKNIIDSIDNLPDGLDLDEKKKKQREKFLFQESVRNIFTSIRFMNADNQLKVILLTSSIPSEGKTLTNILLAKSFADLGQKVLLIDADMRKPKIHERVGLNNLIGLSNFLTDTKIKYEDIVQSASKNQNLNIITAGIIPPDTTRILSSLRLKDFLKDLKNDSQYDLVLFDTPPILGLADAALLAELIDGVILLVNLNKVDRNLPKIALNRIQESGANLLGVISNNSLESTPFTNNSYGNYNYSSSYGYGYDSYSYNPAIIYDKYNNEKNDELEDKNSSLEKSNIYPDKLKKIILVLKEKLRIFIKWIDEN